MDEEETSASKDNEAMEEQIVAMLKAILDENSEGDRSSVAKIIGNYLSEHEAALKAYRRR